MNYEVKEKTEPPTPDSPWVHADLSKNSEPKILQQKLPKIQTLTHKVKDVNLIW